VEKGNRISSLLDKLRDNVRKLKYLSGFSSEEFLSDFTKIESAKHLLQVSIERCIDICNQIIARRQFLSPKSYVESFEILAEEGVLSPSALPAFRQMARFRNRLVHLYWEIDDRALYDILQHHLDDFDVFAGLICDYLAGDAG